MRIENDYREILNKLIIVYGERIRGSILFPGITSLPRCIGFYLVRVRQCRSV